MFFNRLIYLMIAFAFVSSCASSPPTSSVKPNVKPLVSNPHHPNASTVGCKLINVYDAYYRQPVYLCPVYGTNTRRMVLADGRKYYKP